MDGFLTSKTEAGATTAYHYSSRGELKQVDLPGTGVITYSHDPLGRRIAKSVDGTVVERYQWLGRTRLLAVLNADGSLKYRFAYADGRMPVAMTTGAGRYYLAYDQVGSLRAVVDAQGSVVKRITYDSFGNVLEDTNPALTLPFGFAGGLYDPDTGLLRFGFRDYAPDTGRWTAKDPIGFAGGDTDLYGYCVGDPISAVDPEGLLIIKMGFGGQIGAGWGDNSWYGGVSYARYFTLEECGETQGNVVEHQHGSIGGVSATIFALLSFHPGEKENISGKETLTGINHPLVSVELSWDSQNRVTGISIAIGRGISFGSYAGTSTSLDFGGIDWRNKKCVETSPCPQEKRLQNH